MPIGLVPRITLAAGLLAAMMLVGCETAEQHAAVSGGPTIAGCPVFPPDNPWNTDISRLSVHPRSATWLASVGLDKPLHPCFGPSHDGIPNGIPYVVVSAGQPKLPVQFRYVVGSDPGPYPIPANPPIEGGPTSTGDRHILMVDPQTATLYELFAAYPTAGGWKAGSGAVFDLRSNRLRTEGWTSADAAGLPVFPGLVRYDEAAEQGAVRHALRFTVERTQRGYLHPATHYASESNDPDLPPMGMRVRLKSDFEISGFPDEVQVILTALKRYGMYLADNGGDWFLIGAPDERWDDERLATMKRIKVSDFEVVDTGPVLHTG